jgi:hypothetical protein
MKMARHPKRTATRQRTGFTLIGVVVIHHRHPWQRCFCPSSKLETGVEGVYFQRFGRFELRTLCCDDNGTRLVENRGG